MLGRSNLSRKYFVVPTIGHEREILPRTSQWCRPSLSPTGSRYPIVLLRRRLIRIKRSNGSIYHSFPSILGKGLTFGRVRINIRVNGVYEILVSERQTIKENKYQNTETSSETPRVYLFVTSLNQGVSVIDTFSLSYLLFSPTFLFLEYKSNLTKVRFDLLTNLQNRSFVSSTPVSMFSGVVTKSVAPT